MNEVMRFALLSSLLLLVCGCPPDREANTTEQMIDNQKADAQQTEESIMSPPPASNVDEFDGDGAASRPVSVDTRPGERSINDGCSWQVPNVGGGMRIEHEPAGTACGQGDRGKCDGSGKCHP